MPWRILSGMARELRVQTMVSSIVTANTNSAATFKNSTDEDLHIRRIDSGVHMDAAAIGSYAFVETSKSPVLAVATDGNNFPGVSVMTPNVGVAAADINGQKTDLFARGQFVLEPNETLFQNILTVGSENTQGFVTVWYEF